MADPSLTLSNFELTRFFFALVTLLIAAHTSGYLFQRFKLPRVIGEIFGGLLLGPTFLGFFAPNIYNLIFNSFASEGKLLSLMSWFGVIFLMFISGFEVQRAIDKKDRKIISFLILGATIIPFIIGWIAPKLYDFTPYLGTTNNLLALKIVISIAIAVTSIPVISRIFLDLNINKTRFAKIVLTVATIEDVILWVALAIATGLVSSTSASFTSISTTVLITFAFFLISLFLIPYLIKYLNNFRFNLLLKSSVIGYALLICFLFAALASILQVNVIFGAFLAGVVLGSLKDSRFEKVKSNIRELGLAMFIPLYFTLVGLRLNLLHNFEFLFFIGFFLFATFFKMFGTMLASRFAKKDWLSSFNFAVAMNTRGGPGIVLATIAFDLGIINESFFVTLILLAIITSLLAGIWFRYVTSKKLPLLK